MVEINLELTNSEENSFPLLTRRELAALIYVIRKLTRAWELSEGAKDER